MKGNGQTGPSGGGVVFDVGNWRLGDDGAIYRRGRLRLASGDSYDGEWVDGQRHGRGILTLANARGRYVGDFQRNKFHGFGLLELAKSQHPLTRRWRAGQSYEGEFQGGRFHGRGTLRCALPGSSDEDKSAVVTTYDGEFEGGKFHGSGVATYASGDVYDGRWSRGEWHGHGELRLAATGACYVGEFAHGYFHGVGRYSFGRGGGSYVGDYVRGRRHGHGTRVYFDNDGGMRRYEGQWADDEPDGVGALECSAFTLVGQFVRGQAHGRGAKEMASGEAYEGEFRDGFYHGSGRLRYQDGGTFDGEFARGVRHGQGRRVFANGDTYVGQWCNDHMHGRGVLTSVAPAVIGGERSRQVKERGRKTISRRCFMGKTVYDGAFDFGQQTGEARIVYSLQVGGDNNNMAEPDDDQEEDGALEFEFPAGSRCWHQRTRVGVVTYTGSVLRAMFHGFGSLESPDGTIWRGQWENGELHGVGERVYLPMALDAIRDAANGQRDAEKERETLGMYRIVRYEGVFDRGVRHGSGVVTFENGDRVCGTFERGFVHGVARYVFFRVRRRSSNQHGGGDTTEEGKSERMAEYDRGRRVRWLSDEEEAAIHALEEVEQLEQDAARRFEQQVVRALHLDR